MNQPIIYTQRVWGLGPNWPDTVRDLDSTVYGTLEVPARTSFINCNFRIIEIPPWWESISIPLVVACALVLWLAIAARRRSYEDATFVDPEDSAWVIG